MLSKTFKFVILSAVVVLSAPAQAAAEPGQIAITARGSGQPVLMIPGLSSSAAVWDETCAALQPQVQCLIAQLPGFAGAAAGPQQARYLDVMREQLQAVLKAQAPRRVTVMGHSLGGTLALMLAAQLKLSPAGYHFLMWDDLALVQQSIHAFMGLK
ncbi:pimeloyl-ACP methyl ester carboxylesterase [Paucibacter oligotrophus]|uniref:Pimeloyl-ACP methyl ester carboxylesterase n=1 Tax=Roseateles oligotrophus TaxID=1769250 RepID=A0A840L8C1_9BURK|nr:alpha/beta fold hydrolase [Roseateles oligotrophus]MBB4842945.1 pimeloyl-ACP methyl ester carboxylesterase [Roseateles oligotrophus]